MSRLHKVNTAEVLAASHGMNVVIVSRDEVGALFLTTLARVNDREVRYLGISVDARRLEQIKSGLITLREAFLNRQGCWIDGYTDTPRPKGIAAKVRSGTFPEAYLPPDLPLRRDPPLEIYQSPGR